MAGSGLASIHVLDWIMHFVARKNLRYPVNCDCLEYKLRAYMRNEWVWATSESNPSLLEAIVWPTSVWLRSILPRSATSPRYYGLEYGARKELRCQFTAPTSDLRVLTCNRIGKFGGQSLE